MGPFRLLTNPLLILSKMHTLVTQINRLNSKQRAQGISEGFSSRIFEGKYQPCLAPVLFTPLIPTSPSKKSKA